MKRGFTLAEVILTLGILGVIAAITLPGLNNNIWKGQRAPLLKNAHERIGSAFSLALQDLNYTPQCAYTLNSVEDETLENTPENWPGVFDEKACEDFGNTILANLKITRECSNASSEDENGSGEETTETISNSCQPEYNIDGFYDISKSKTYYLANGVFLINYYPDKEYFYPAIFVVDTNGVKGPNKWGQDLFTFTTNYARNGRNLVLKPGNDATLTEVHGELSGATAEEILRNRK